MIHMAGKFRRGGIVLLAALTAALTGCGSAQANAPAVTGNSSAAAVDSEKTLTIASGQATSSGLDPVVDYDGWYDLRYGICQTLMKMNDDLSVSAWLCTDTGTSNADYTEWTFTIRDDVTFSDGTKLTGDLAAASLRNVFTNGQRGNEYFTPAEITADGQTLTIKTSEPEPILPNKLADPLFAIINTSADTSNLSENGPVGTGPFVVDSYDPTTRECVVVKNENYWGGDVALNRIDFKYTEDQSALTMALQAGEFDAVYNVSMNDVGTFESSPDYTVEKGTSGRTTIGFMNEKGQLGDIVLREAILRALDKQTYCSSLLMGQYTPGITPLTSAADYGYSELKDPNAYDPDSAKQLLDQAGYKDTDGDGYREDPDGKPISLDYVYYTGRPEQQIMVEATQSALAELGIRVTPDVQDTSVVMNRLQTGDYDMLCMSINMMNCGDPENQLRTFFGRDGTYNASGYDSQEFNDLLDQISVTADPDQRKELVKQAEQVMLDDAAAIYYCYPTINFVMKKNVSGIHATAADFYWVDENTDVS